MSESSAGQPTISVAMCTYNGETYLAEQLESLLRQTRLPDELVVCDDHSTDHTLQILEFFAAQSPFPIRIIQNETRLGYNKNFEKALGNCTGDLIFVSDQDDYWLPEKIEEISDFLMAHPDVDLVFSNAQVADNQLNSTNMLFWERVSFTDDTRQRWVEGEALDILLDGNRVMGCASAIRRDLLDAVLPIPDVPGYIYDGWMALVAAARGTIRFYEKPLLIYRTHENQQVGVRPEPTNRFVSLRERFTRARSEKLQPFISKREQLRIIRHLLDERVPDSPFYIDHLQSRLDFYTVRSTLPRPRIHRFGPVMREWFRGNYKRFADPTAGWRAPIMAALGDLFE